MEKKSGVTESVLEKTTIHFSEQLSFQGNPPSSERARANHAKMMRRKDAQCN